MTNSPNALRARFRREGIDPANIIPEPMQMFRAWHADWVSVAPFDPMLFTLATVDGAGMPSVRAMDFVASDTGIVFATHGDSPKSRDLARNPNAAACFVWPEIGRQIRMQGMVATLSETDADAAFMALPSGIRNVARATHQSTPVADRATLEGIVAGASGPDKRPDSWVAMRLVPSALEFWQQRPSDIQDRVLYRSVAPEHEWSVSRLCP